MKHPRLQCHHITYPKLLPNKPAVYILIDERGKPIYIGQSKNLKARISGHEKKVDAEWVAYFPLDCPEEERLEMEKSFINHYKPALNTTHKWLFTNDFTWV